MGTGSRGLSQRPLVPLPPGRARVPRAAHTPCPAAQESVRRQPGAGDWNDGRAKRMFRGEDRGTRSLPGVRACGPVSYPAAVGAAAPPGRARVPRAAHTPCPAAQESSRRQPGAGDWNDGRVRRTFRGRPVGHGPYRACGPTARSLTQRPQGPLPPGRARVPRAAHTPCPAAQESVRRQPGAGDWNDGRPRRTFRGRPVGHGPYRACGPAARSLTQRPQGPLPPSVGPESLGPPTHRAQQLRNRAAASQVPEIGTMVGPGVRSGGGSWDTVPTGGACLRPGLLPSGRRGRCLLW